MIAAALLCRITSVLLEGSPVSPPDRFASIIERRRVSVLKAGAPRGLTAPAAHRTLSSLSHLTHHPTASLALDISYV